MWWLALAFRGVACALFRDVAISWVDLAHLLPKTVFLLCSSSITERTNSWWHHQSCFGSRCLSSCLCLPLLLLEPVLVACYSNQRSGWSLAGKPWRWIMRAILQVIKNVHAVSKTKIRVKKIEAKKVRLEQPTSFGPRSQDRPFYLTLVSPPYHCAILSVSGMVGSKWIV